MGQGKENPEESHHGAASGDAEVGAYLQIAAEGRSVETEEASPPVVDLPPRGDAVREAVAVIDFGSQYSQLIARRVRECNVYCELVPWDADWERVKALQPRGFILSGGPASIYAPGAPRIPDYVLESGLPVLGICYGLQAMAHQLGGKVSPASRREYGHADLLVDEASFPLFAGLPSTFSVWMSHGDHVDELPPGFRPIAHTGNAPVAATARGNLIGLQFHPEVVHTQHGKAIIDNFLTKICGCQGTWTPGSFINETVANIRSVVGDGKVICGLSGGVDSSVAATLVHRAIGDQLTCIFVDNGLLRRGEAARTVETFRRNMQMNLIHVDATDRFLAGLAGVVDPEVKRRIIGNEFIRVFDEEALKLGKIDYLAQGTLYPDVIESTTPDTKAAARIKTHHNVGGLPKDLRFSLIEPLRYLFKDEVRTVGLEVGLPEEIVFRQPFPGPGLAVRVIGEVTRERLETLRACDWIVVDEIKKAGYYRQVWQAFAVLTSMRSVGVMGDGRTYADVVALRVVTSEDGMTADWARLPYDLLARISSRIVNEVPGVNRVVYDVSSKPPATIEWE
ncbi:MAG: glutamine-hydrolyzing GMP synthase [Dehalococcoidales bacterium]|nr:glutamine-hydrolyzing GMP synthase [Dehalococcoidales bacterium]